MVSSLGFIAVLASTLLLSPVQSLKVNTGIPVNSGIHSVSTSKRYLISSFPKIKTVAYTHLPDTIWRPLFVGKVSHPEAIVTDPLNARLFVSDKDNKRIFWYQLIIEADGLLKTDGHQHVAVDGVTADWLAVDGLGDLYFTGQMIVEAPKSSYRSVYRMDENKIASGNAMNPVEVYSRSNSGFPVPRVWMPSGISVDSFNIYWGNQEKGTTNGAVCSGTRQNIGVTTAPEISVINQAINEVRGVSIAGQSVFYAGPAGIYGAVKGESGTISSNGGPANLVQGGVGVDGMDPRSIAFDGENTMYWTETKAGIIYQFPAGETNKQPMTKYMDAPLVSGLTIFAQTGEIKGALNKDYGKPQSSAQAVEDSGAPTGLNLSLLAALISASVLAVW